MDWKRYAGYAALGTYVLVGLGLLYKSTQYLSGKIDYALDQELNVTYQKPQNEVVVDEKNIQEVKAVMGQDDEVRAQDMADDLIASRIQENKQLAERYSKFNKSRKSIMARLPFMVGLMKTGKTWSQMSDNQKTQLKKTMDIIEKADTRDIAYDMIEDSPLPSWNNVTISQSQQALCNYINYLTKNGKEHFSLESGGILIGTVKNGTLNIEKFVPVSNDEEDPITATATKFKLDMDEFEAQVMKELDKGKMLVGTYHIHPTLIGSTGVKNDGAIRANLTPDNIPSNADWEAWEKSVFMFNQIGMIINCSTDPQYQYMIVYHKPKGGKRRVFKTFPLPGCVKLKTD